MTSREFAIEVTQRLQTAGYTALWAGGCVRDSLLDRTPKDFDVATSATPDQVQDLFGHKRTLAIGKSFGVITVIGPKSADPIEIATFRRDGGYSDGRRPDSIEFTDAREDAIRRDFTINGMFYDPIAEQVIDYVGGQEDIGLRVVRAIGDPDARIEEDKLRMLRGVRFASTFGFDLEPKTLNAIQERAKEITVVSAERIGNEVRRMFRHDNRALAFDLLLKSRLWSQIVPTVEGSSRSDEAAGWKTERQQLERLGRSESADFGAVIAILFDDAIQSSRNKKNKSVFLADLQTQWRLTNDEMVRTDWINRHWQTLSAAHQHPWSVIQPLLLSPHASFALDCVAAKGLGSMDEAVAYCRDRLAWPTEQLDPAPLLDGGALMGLGIEPGPQFKELLGAVRAMQLDGELSTAEAATQWVKGQGG